MLLYQYIEKRRSIYSRVKVFSGLLGAHLAEVGVSGISYVYLVKLKNPPSLTVLMY